MMESLNIKYVDPKSLTVPEWRATHILRPDLLVLSASLGELGFIEPIHVRKSTGEIIDGSERFLLATTIKQIYPHIKNGIPVIEHDVDSLSAMMLHLRLNRGRGTIVAKRMSNIIKKLRLSGKYKVTDFESMLCMKSEELSLMLDGSLIKTRNIAEHKYSRAWVPVEAPPGTIDSGPIIERPPNEDR
jgi:hypothetical protein